MYCSVYPFSIFFIASSLYFCFLSLYFRFLSFSFLGCLVWAHPVQELSDFLPNSGV